MQQQNTCGLNVRRWCHLSNCAGNQSEFPVAISREPVARRLAAYWIIRIASGSNQKRNWFRKQYIGGALESAPDWLSQYEVVTWPTAKQFHLRVTPFQENSNFTHFSSSHVLSIAAARWLRRSDKKDKKDCCHKSVRGNGEAIYGNYWKYPQKSIFDRLPPVPATMSS